MLKKALIVVAVLVVVLVVVVALQPATFRVARSATIAAPPSAVFAQVNDFHRWEAWNPWQKLDPGAKNTYSGAPAGEGAAFAWDGNDDVGAGKMTIVESRPDDLVRIRLDFLRPMEATNTAEFTFVPEAQGTRVTWSMTGENGFLGKAVGLVMDMDQMVGSEFEKGLASMKSVAESDARKSAAGFPGTGG
jgi:carbon monoxide dehydrogenase subunit G